jgi:uncharacterized membrane protein YqjE
MTPTTHQEPSTADLVKQLADQTSRLVREEVELAKAELQIKGKQAGVGAGMFGGAGLFGVFAFGALTAAIIAALSLAMATWLAALIVAVVYGVIAGVAALMGKKNVSEAGAPKPERAIEGIKQDVATVKGDHR